MARHKSYMGIDVLTAAKQRVERIFDTHDTVVVCFSGGKDSLVVLHLIKDEAERRKQLPVNVVFNDEELIPDEVINFVDEYRKEPWIDMKWFCLPGKHTMYVLGKVSEYIMWDPNREHVRPMPPWAIRFPPGDTRITNVNATAEFSLPYFKGKVAYCTGVRAAESIMRHQGVMKKLHEPYICAGDFQRQSQCKPIYDWQENDVFKFFYDRGIKYAPIYDAQNWGGVTNGKFMVSTPLHSESAKYMLPRLATISPSFYNRLLQLFPEAAIQARYWSQTDLVGKAEAYGDSLEGLRQYILDNVDEEKQGPILQRFDRVVARSKLNPGDYPLGYVLKWLVGGATRELMRIPHAQQEQAWAQERRRQEKRAKNA